MKRSRAKNSPNHPSESFGRTIGMFDPSILCPKAPQNGRFGDLTFNRVRDRMPVLQVINSIGHD